MDSAVESTFDRITEMVRYVLGVPVALVSLVDARRQFFKSALGLGGVAGEARETPLSHSFCQHVVATNKPLIVEDARDHPVVRDNLAIADLGVIGYLGVPIHSPDGYALGSLCAIDNRPHAWSEGDMAAMQTLVVSVETEIALRAEAKAQQRATRSAQNESRAFAALTSVNTRLAGELNPKRLLRTVVDTGIDLLDAQVGAFLRRCLTEGVTDFVSFGGDTGAAFDRFAVTHAHAIQTTLDDCVITRIDDVGSSDRRAEEGLGGVDGVRSLLVVPVRDSDDQVLGALLFGSAHPSAFDERSERLVQAFSDQVAIALRNAHLLQRVESSELDQRLILSGLHDVVFRATDGTVDYLNEAWEERTGVSAADVLGQPLTDLVGPVDSWDELEHGRIERRIVVPHADGRSLHFEASWVQQIGSTGSITLIGALTDVSDSVRLHAEREAREAAEIARAEAERMSRLRTALLANMSHEIRTPISAIIACADLLEDEVPDDAREFTGMIRTSSRRLLGTLSSVLEMAQLEALEVKNAPRKLDARRVVTQAAQPALQEAKANGLALTVDVEPDLTLTLDPHLLERILVHLLDNAVKFTQFGSIRVALGRTEDSARLVVEDTGVGIAADVQRHMFSPFQQGSDGLDRAYEGTGLGLTIVRKMVALMGGVVSVESESGAGCRVIVDFPQAG